MINKTLVFNFLFVLIATQNLYAQLNVNIFNEQAFYHTASDTSFLKHSCRFDQSDFLLNNNYPGPLLFGVDLSMSAQNSAVGYYQNYNDHTHYMTAPYVKFAPNDHLTFFTRLNLENARDRYVYPLRPFYGKDYSGLRAAFDIAKIEYHTTHFSVTFGRDYFMPGVYFYENLLFSRYNTPYDQLRLRYTNSYFTLESYYLSLRPMPEDGIIAQRYLAGHRFTLNLPAGYLAFNDLMIYGGEKQPFDLMAQNPLLLLYPYVANKKHLTANNLMSLEAYYNYRNYYLFLELVIDDFQVDHKVPGDLEPPEWGINATIGKDNLLPNLSWKLNYTRVANRTFNAPVLAHEKYIHDNYPIGHWLGNNFWEAKTSFIYRAQPNWLTDLTISFLQYGDEALYGAFNTDYLNYSVKNGYVEKFPFGNVKAQAGLILKSYYNISPDLLLSGSFSYWPKNTRLENDLNFGVSLAYRIVWQGPAHGRVVN